MGETILLKPGVQILQDLSAMLNEIHSIQANFDSAKNRFRTVSQKNIAVKRMLEQLEKDLRMI